MGTKQKDMYSNIEPFEAYLIVSKCEWLRKSVYDIDNMNDDGEASLIRATYSGVQHYGATDYNEHRKDTNSELKLLLWDSITARKHNSHQRIHYYKNKDINKPYTKILYWGEAGGYSARFID